MLPCWSTSYEVPVLGYGRFEDALRPHQASNGELMDHVPEAPVYSKQRGLKTGDADDAEPVTKNPSPGANYDLHSRLYGPSWHRSACGATARPSGGVARLLDLGTDTAASPLYRGAMCYISALFIAVVIAEVQGLVPRHKQVVVMPASRSKRSINRAGGLASRRFPLQAFWATAERGRAWSHITRALQRQTRLHGFRYGYGR